MEISDYIAPGLLLAQSIGRWGNFVNQEAYGNLITNPAHQWFPLAVKVGENYYQATFFYESVCTLIGFVLVMLLLRSKRFRKGLAVAFYGIYYGTVRLVIEGLRSDSLYLWLGDFNTGIRISQLVSCITITLGIYRLCNAYIPELQSLFDRLLNKLGLTTVHAAAVLETGGGEKDETPFDRVFLFITGKPFKEKQAQAEEKENLSDESGADASQSDAKSETDSKDSDKVMQKRKKKQKNDKDV